MDVERVSRPGWLDLGPPAGVSDIVPRYAFHNDRTEPIPGRQPPRVRCPVPRCLPVEPGHDRWTPGQKTACGVVSLRRQCPDQVPGGRRSASPLSSLSAFPSRLRLPGGWCGPAPSITSQTIVRLHGTEDGHPGPKAPACTGRTSYLRRKPRQRSAPYPVPCMAFLAACPVPARLRTLRVGGGRPCQPSAPDSWSALVRYRCREALGIPVLALISP